MSITSISHSTGVTRTNVFEVFESEKGTIYTKVVYQTGENAVNFTEFIGSSFELCNVEDRIWSYNGGGESFAGDTLRKIDLTDSSTFYMENIQDYTAACIPLADIYTADGGISVGDASATRREVRTPVKETTTSAQIGIKWPAKAVEANTFLVQTQKQQLL